MILVGFRGPHTRSWRDLAVKFKMASWRVKGGQGVASFVNPGCFFSLDNVPSLYVWRQRGVSLSMLVNS